MASQKQFALVAVKSKSKSILSFKDTGRGLSVVITDGIATLFTQKGEYEFVKHPHLNQFEAKLCDKYNARLRIKDSVCTLWYW